MGPGHNMMAYSRLKANYAAVFSIRPYQLGNGGILLLYVHTMADGKKGINLTHLLIHEQLQDILQLVEEQHLLGAAAPWPEPDQALRQKS